MSQLDHSFLDARTTPIWRKLSVPQLRDLLKKGANDEEQNAPIDESMGQPSTSPEVQGLGVPPAETPEETPAMSVPQVKEYIDSLKPEQAVEAIRDLAPATLGASNKNYAIMLAQHPALPLDVAMSYATMPKEEKILNPATKQWIDLNAPIRNQLARHFKNPPHELVSALIENASDGRTASALASNHTISPEVCRFLFMGTKGLKDDIAQVKEVRYQLRNNPATPEDIRSALAQSTIWKHMDNENTSALMEPTTPGTYEAARQRLSQPLAPEPEIPTKTIINPAIPQPKVLPPEESRQWQKLVADPADRGKQIRKEIEKAEQLRNAPPKEGPISEGKEFQRSLDIANVPKETQEKLTRRLERERKSLENTQNQLNNLQTPEGLEVDPRHIEEFKRRTLLRTRLDEISKRLDDINEEERNLLATEGAKIRAEELKRWEETEKSDQEYFKGAYGDPEKLKELSDYIAGQARRYLKRYLTLDQGKIPIVRNFFQSELPQSGVFSDVVSEKEISQKDRETKEERKKTKLDRQQEKENRDRIRQQILDQVSAAGGAEEFAKQHTQEDLSNWNRVLNDIVGLEGDKQLPPEKEREAVEKKMALSGAFPEIERKFFVEEVPGAEGQPTRFVVKSTDDPNFAQPLNSRELAEKQADSLNGEDKYKAEVNKMYDLIVNTLTYQNPGMAERTIARARKIRDSGSPTSISELAILLARSRGLQLGVEKAMPGQIGETYTHRAPGRTGWMDEKLIRADERDKMKQEKIRQKGLPSDERSKGKPSLQYKKVPDEGGSYTPGGALYEARQWLDDFNIRTSAEFQHVLDKEPNLWSRAIPIFKKFEMKDLFPAEFATKYQDAQAELDDTIKNFVKDTVLSIDPQFVPDAKKRAENEKLLFADPKKSNLVRDLIQHPEWFPYVSDEIKLRLKKFWQDSAKLLTRDDRGKAELQRLVERQKADDELKRKFRDWRIQKMQEKPGDTKEEPPQKGALSLQRLKYANEGPVVSLTEQGLKVLRTSNKGPMYFVLNAINQFGMTPEEIAAYGPDKESAYQTALSGGLISVLNPTIAKSLKLHKKHAKLRLKADVAGPGGPDWTYQYTSGQSPVVDKKVQRDERFEFSQTKPTSNLSNPKDGQQGNLLKVGPESTTMVNHMEAWQKLRPIKTSDNDQFDSYLYELGDGKFVAYSIFKKRYAKLCAGDLVIQCGKDASDSHVFRRRYGSVKRAYEKLEEALLPAFAYTNVGPVSNDSLAESPTGKPGTTFVRKGPWDQSPLQGDEAEAFKKPTSLTMKRNVAPHMDTPDSEGIMGTTGAVSNDILSGGKADKVPNSKFDKTQLNLGQKVEKEHTNSPGVAKEIATDHLTEIPDYYTRLNKMEEDAKRDPKLDLKKADLGGSTIVTTQSPEDASWKTQPNEQSMTGVHPKWNWPLKRKRPIEKNETGLTGQYQGNEKIELQ
jgi:hypothetical protein